MPRRFVPTQQIKDSWVSNLRSPRKVFSVRPRSGGLSNLPSPISNSVSQIAEKHESVRVQSAFPSVCRSNSVIHIKALRSATNHPFSAWRCQKFAVKDSSVIKKSTVITQRLFRTKDAAHYLGMSAWALRKEVGKGALPFISSGEHTSSWKFDVADLDAWVERHRVNF